MSFKTTTSKLKSATDSVQALSKLNRGALGEWKEYIDGLPDGSKTKTYLLTLDTSNRQAVQEAISHYQNERINLQKRVKLHTEDTNDAISEVVSELSGKEVKIDINDLDLYSEFPIPMPPDLEERIFGAAE